MKKALVIANMLFASSTVFGMFQFGANAPGAGNQPNTSGFTFTAPVNRADTPVQITCVDDGSTQTEIVSLEERSMQTENSENLNNSLQDAFLSYIKSKSQATDLMVWAAKSNQQGVIDYLIGNNVDVNGAINGQNSLYQAIFNKNLELADHLILNGAKFNENDKENLLFNAIDTNNLENVKYLIGKEVNIGYRRGIGGFNSMRESFLDRAVSRKYFDIAKYLIENGAKTRNLRKHQVSSIAIECDGLEFIKYLISSNYVSVDSTDINKRTLLHNAVISNKFDIVEYLVGVEGININAQDNNLYTPLLYAAEKKQTDIAELLIKKLVENNISLDTMGGTNRLQKTPLYEASSNGSLDIVKLLEENGANLNKRASNGTSPAEIAIQNNHIDVAKYLIEHGVDVNSTDNNGMSLLSQAIVKNSENSADLVNYLIEKGAKINRQSNDGWTPLHEAVQTGNKEIVQILLDHDAFVNAADTNGWTPLHEASHKGNLGIFKLLEENGANIYAPVFRNFSSNKGSYQSGATPTSIAQNRGYSNIVNYLNNKSSRFTSGLLAVHNK